MNLEIDSIEFDASVCCNHCKEIHGFNDSAALYGSNDTDFDDVTIVCKCGAKIEVSWEASLKLSEKHTPPPAVDDFKDIPPAPNQIDLFTGKQVSAQNKES